MVVKTRNYRLEKRDYIKMALKSILKQQWWVSLIFETAVVGKPYCTGHLPLLFVDTQYLVVYWGVCRSSALSAFLVDSVLRSNPVRPGKNVVRAV